MYVVKYIKYGSEEYNKTLELRNEVMRKPLGRNIYDEDFSCEENQIIIGAFETNSIFTNLLIGCGVLSYQGDNTWMVEYLCVDSVLQKKGVGSALMQCMEKIAMDRGATKMTLDARVSAIDFYQRFGYIPQGEVFHKEIAPGGHIVMEKELHSIPKEEKSKAGCSCGHDHHHGHGHSHHHDENCSCGE